MAPREIKKVLVTLANRLENVPEQMRTFSASMRSLFAENAVGTSSDRERRFRKLLDETRNNAVVYTKVVLPLVKQCMSDIKGYFEYYQDLAIDEWWNSLTDIIKEAKAHKEVCKVLVAIHNDIITDLNKRHSDAIILMSDINGSLAEIERQGTEPRVHENGMGIFSIIITTVSYIWHAVLSILRAAEETDRVDTIAVNRESSNMAGAVAVVRDKLVPALSEFVNGLQDVARFFSAIHQELESLQKARDVTESHRIHYNTIRDEAHQMIARCNKFFAVLPAVRTDMEAIPKVRADRILVANLIEKQKAVIRDKCSNQNLARKLLEVITKR